MAIKKNQILGAVFELPAKQHCQFSLTKKWAKWAELAVLLSWQLQNSPRILIFSIAMGADYSICVKFIATRAPTFFGYIISVLASVTTT